MTNLERLQAWADSRRLVVSTGHGTQRDPENLVAISFPGSNGSALITKTSLDSIDTAAWYVLNTLEALGVDLSGNSLDN